MTEAISVSALVKTFGRTRALDGLDLFVATGEVHGFLGPNGAGKSTTLRILLGLLRHDSGTARVLGGGPVGAGHRSAPAAGLRPGRRHAVAQPLRRGSRGPAGTAAGRAGPGEEGRTSRALRTRPHKAGAHLLQGQPPKGCPGRRARLRCGAAFARRAHLRARPADGSRLQRLHQGREQARQDGASVQPHPRRGRGPV